MRRALFLFTLLTSPLTHAGYLEFGVSGSFKQANIDDYSWDTATAYTGSVAWYFDVMSALEMSYTYGQQQRYLHFQDRPDQTTTANYELVGGDLVLTFFAQDAVVRPYVKGGGAYLLRKDVVFETGGTSVKLNEQSGFVPSAGAGFKIAMTRDFALKVGTDGWASTPGKADRWDYVMRAGLSLMF